MKGGAPFQELVSPHNENYTATLSGRSWHLINVVRTRAKMHAVLDEVRNMTKEQAATLPHPLEILAELGLRSSGSIQGAFRKDFVNAMQGYVPPKNGLVNGRDETLQFQEVRNGL